MKANKFLLTLLHILAAAASFQILLPVLLLLDTLTFNGTDNRMILRHYGIVMLFAVAGFLLMRCLHIKRVWQIVCGSVMLLAAILLTRSGQYLGWYLCMAGGYALGIYAGARDYGSVLTGAQMYSTVGVHLGVMLLCMAFSWNRGFSTDFTLFIPEGILYLCAYLMIQNQSHIDYLMGRVGVDTDKVSFRMRGYNLLLTVGLVLLPGLFFLFRDSFAQLVGWLGKLVVLLWAGIDRLVSVIFGTENADVEDIDPPAVGEGMEWMQEEGENWATSNAVFSGTVIVLAAAALIFVIIRFRLIQKLFRFGKAAFSDFFRQMQNRFVKKGETRERAAFTDSLTQLADEPKQRRKSDPVQQWKADYRQYRKMTDPNVRYQAGFLLLRAYLEIQKLPIQDGDTANEIYHKTDSTPLAFADEIAAGYNLLCYAGQGASAKGQEQLDAYLTGVSKKIK